MNFAVELRNNIECHEGMFTGQITRIQSFRKNGPVTNEKFVVEGSLYRGQHRKTQSETVRDLEEKKVSKEVIKHINAWQSFMKTPLIHASVENRSQAEYDDDNDDDHYYLQASFGKTGES